MVQVLLYYFLAEFGPVFAFFIVSQFSTFFVATGTLIATTMVAFTMTWVRDKRIPVIPLVAGVFVVIAGVLTLVYKEPDALIFSDTLYYLFIAGALGVGLLNKKLILKMLGEDVFAMSDHGWRLLTLRWLHLCIIAAILNEIVRLNMSVEFWVHYKFAKVIVITIFGFYQFKLAREYRIMEESNKWGVRNSMLDCKTIKSTTVPAQTTQE